MLPSIAGAKDSVEDWLSKKWYATEVIVFQRGPVMENSTAEKLVLLGERHFPFALRTFVPPPGAIGSFYALDPITRATLEFQTFDIDLENFSFLEPTTGLAEDLEDDTSDPPGQNDKDTRISGRKPGVLGARR